MAEEGKKRAVRTKKQSVNLDTLGLEVGNRPPQALDVEEAVLGALLIEPNCIDEAMDELTSSCFYSEKHRMIFEAMRQLTNEHIALDFLSVSQKLKANGNLEAVGGTVADVAVGDSFKEDGSLTFFDDFPFAFEGVDNSKGIVTVNSFSVEIVGTDTGTDTGSDVISHRFAAGLTAHTVTVVDAVEDQRQTALEIFVPEFEVLVHRSKVESFPDRTASHRTVTHVANHHTGLAVDFLVEGSTDGDTGGTADDGVVGIDTERQEEDVH